MTFRQVGVSVRVRRVLGLEMLAVEVAAVAIADALIFFVVNLMLTTVLMLVLLILAVVVLRLQVRVRLSSSFLIQCFRSRFAILHHLGLFIVPFLLLLLLFSLLLIGFLFILPLKLLMLAELCPMALATTRLHLVQGCNQRSDLLVGGLGALLPLFVRLRLP